MDFTPSDKTRALCADIQQWSVSELRPFAREADRTHSVPEGAKKALETCPIQISPFAGKIDYPDRGEPGFPADEVDGGYTLSFSAAEALVYGDVLGLVVTRGNGIGGKVVSLMGNQEQRERWAGGLDRGEFHYSGFSLTEPHSGSDAGALRTTAVRDGDHFVINGQKQFTTGGAISDFVVVFATVDPDLGSRGIRGFVVEKGTAGFEVVRANENKLGSRVFSTSSLSFSDVVVPVENCLGWPDTGVRGFSAALATLNTTRASIAAVAAGLAQAAIDEGRTWLDSHRAEFTVTRAARFDEELDRMDTAVETVRHLYRRVAYRMDHGLDYGRYASMAKAVGTQTGEKIVGRVQQLMGPDGYSEEYLVEKWVRDVKIQDIWEGTGNIQRTIVARHIGVPDLAPA